MSIGINPTKEQIDATAGDILSGLTRQLRRARELKRYLDGQTTEALVAKGYDEAGATEVSQLKSGIGAADDLRKIWEGEIDHTPAADMRTFPRRLQGMGDV